MKILKYTYILLIMSALNNDCNAALPGNSEPHFTCIHQDVISLTRKRIVPLPPEPIYAYAYINIVDEVCPPFNDAHRTPANVINIGGNLDVYWEPEVHEHSECEEIPAECSVPSNDQEIKDLCQQYQEAQCPNKRDVATGHGCNRGYFF